MIHCILDTLGIGDLNFQVVPYVASVTQTSAHRRAFAGMLSRAHMELPVFEPSCTVKGELPPWETAKASALHTVIETFSV